MEDPNTQKVTQNIQQQKKSKNNPKKKVKSAQKNKKDKNNKEGAKKVPAMCSTSEAFSFSDLDNNKQVSAHLYELVKCFTSNSTLPKNELDVLNLKLYEKSVSVFLQIINGCVEKIFNKLKSAGLLQKKVAKKDACCQTD